MIKIEIDKLKEGINMGLGSQGIWTPELAEIMLIEIQNKALNVQNVSNSISDEGLIELYRIAYNDGFDNIGDKKDTIKHRQKKIAIIKKKYCC